MRAASPRRWSFERALVGLCFALSGCHGSIEQPAPSAGGSNGTGTGGTSGSTAAGGSSAKSAGGTNSSGGSGAKSGSSTGGSSASGGSSGTSGGGGAQAGGSAVPTALESVGRRLTRTELDNVVRDLFGDQTAPASKYLAEDQ